MYIVRRDSLYPRTFETNYSFQGPTNFVVHVDPRLRGNTAVAESEVVSNRVTTGSKEVESYNTLDLLAKVPLNK